MGKTIRFSIGARIRDAFATWALALGLALAGVCAAVPPATATIRVSPVIVELSPNGGGAESAIRLENNRAQPVAVELSVLVRRFAPDGTETTAPADDDFLIFPPQALIGGGDVQSIRFRFIGPPGLDATRSYFVRIVELPIALAAPAEDEGAGDGGALNLLLDFLISIHVSPAGARPDLSVTGVSDRGRTVDFSVRNAGRRYDALSNHVVRLLSAEGAVLRTFVGRELLEVVESTLVPPGVNRRFSLPSGGAGSVARVEIAPLGDASR